MALSDEIYMKHHVSELKDLEAYVVKLWREGQERWCQRTHGMSCDEWYASLDNKLEDGPIANYEFNNDGVGGYGSSGRKPLPKEFWDE